MIRKFTINHKVNLINDNIIWQTNTSLFYQKEDSEWGFEVEVSNIFDTKFKQQSSFSDFLITDQRTFILPRMVMLKVSYKL